MQVYRMDIPSLEKEFNTDIVNGLPHNTSDFVAKNRSQKVFLNKLGFHLKDNLYVVDLIIFLCYFISAVFSLLNHRTDAFIYSILALIFSTFVYCVASGIIGYREAKFEEGKNKKALKIQVIRAGGVQLVDQDDLQLGDLLILEPGTIVYADARIVSDDSLFINESLVFSTTVASCKNSDILLNEGVLPEEQKNMVWSGSFVESGTGKAVVVALGKDCYVEKTGGREVKKHQSSFMSQQKNIGRIFCYVYLVLVAAILLISVLASSRIIDCFLIMGLLLTVICVNPALLLTNWSYYRLAGRMLKQGIIIRDFEALDQIEKEDKLFFDCGMLIERSTSLREIYAIKCSDDDVLLYYNLCKGCASSEGDETAVDRLRNEFPLVLQQRDERGNLFSVFAKGGKSVLIGIGYWTDMKSYVEMDQDVNNKITGIEAEGYPVYVMASTSFDYVPTRIDEEQLAHKLDLLALPIYEIKKDDSVAKRVGQFNRLGLKTVLLSDYSDVLNSYVIDIYGFRQCINHDSKKHGYSFAAINQYAPIVVDDSLPVYQDQAQIIVGGETWVSDLVYDVKCMFAGIKRVLNFVVPLLIFGVICAVPLLCNEFAISGLVPSLALLPISMLIPVHFISGSVRNYNKNRRSFIFGTLCGVFALITAVTNNGGAFFLLELSMVWISLYISISNKGDNPINWKELSLVLFALLVQIATLIIVVDGWLAVLLISVLPTVCAFIIDRIY